jgi:hypothetical protein
VIKIWKVIQHKAFKRYNRIRKVTSKFLKVKFIAAFFPVLEERFVQTGIFKGMHYPIDAFGSALIPKLAGTYESDLQSWLGKLLKSNAQFNLIDIGAAEGWYAVGLALSSRVERVVAFESSTKARYLMNQLAEANGVLEKIQIESEFSGGQQFDFIIEGLNTLNTTLLICDIEGGEELFLDTNLTLDNYFFIFECHDHIIPEIGNKLRLKFSHSHNVLKITLTTGHKFHFGWASRLPTRIQGFLLSEERRSSVDNYWLLGTPKIKNTRRNESL